MTRKLLVLDVLLVAAVSAAGFQFHKAWLAAQARAASTLHQTVKPVKLAPLAPLAGEPGVTPATYVEVAANMLFDASRNPTVIIEKPAPPPPKPMPPLPSYHGMLDLGGGPIAILSANASAPHKAIQRGEKIGEFTLIDADGDGITLEWDGKQIHKTLDQLNGSKDSPAPPPAQASDARTAVAATAATLDAPAPRPAATPAEMPKAGPGEMTGFGFRICNMNDGVAEGAVMDGFRKTIHTTPFGETCTYNPVK